MGMVKPGLSYRLETVFESKLRNRSEEVLSVLKADPGILVSAREQPEEDFLRWSQYCLSMEQIRADPCKYKECSFGTTP